MGGIVSLTECKTSAAGFLSLYGDITVLAES